MIATVVHQLDWKTVFKIKVMITIVLISCIVVSLTSAAKYPSDLPRCKAGDSVCLPKVITEILNKYPNGHKGLKMPVMEPLHINKLEMWQKENSPIAINLTFNHLDMYGSSETKILRIVGFEADPTTSKFEVTASIPKLSIFGKYTMSGIILILPILGSGNSSIVFDNVLFTVRFKPKVTEKNGKKYIQTERYDLSFDTTRMHLHFENIFDGNKELSDDTNWFLNENWRYIFLEVRPLIEFAVEEMAKSVINRIFLKLPYNEIFLPSNGAESE
ncbi:protein takeout-like isoform X2 [Bradysia coprophila]|uniref:protein takeout-like isoform X2 n=1 Tax=Bradysia coprophila TaxID=38358 RepID=UPI00187DD959|nr:protein takeout-like isoform X2 [Bradysia coprophila]